MRTPDFFLIGAPRCGTTALATYLSEHPRIFFSNPKEPFYWCSDVPGLRRYTRIDTPERYAALFEAATTDHLAVGEGSTEYLRSACAVRAILQQHPQSRFIVMLRNPVDLVVSFHGVQVFTLSEDVADFEAAWRLQAARAQGRDVPKQCLDLRLLMYGDVGRLGTQVERFFQQVPPEQRLTILFDDFVNDPRRVYESVLAFLGVPDDRRTEFPRVHESRIQRHAWLHRWVRRPPTVLARPVMSLRRWLNTHRTGIVPWVKGFFSRPAQRPELRPEFREELRLHFAEEVALLSSLLHRDLTHWT